MYVHALMLYIFIYGNDFFYFRFFVLSIIISIIFQNNENIFYTQKEILSEFEIIREIC